MGDGVVFRTYVDDNLRPGIKNGGLRIDYGVHVLADGRVQRVIAQFDHVVPVIAAGRRVQAHTHVADFSTCERYGAFPELMIEVLILSPQASEGITWRDLNGYCVDYVDTNGWPHIDPKLVGLEPN